ncbi:MAG: hypothetical protein AAGF12_03055 [Myxococcota bacterium]
MTRDFQALHLLMLGLLAWHFGPTVAAACSCAPPDPAAAFESASSVFEGRVLRVDPDGQLRRATLEVVRTWKGADSEEVDVRTAANSAACGFDFTVGESYLVYADERNGEEHVSLCSPTKPIGEAGDELAAMGEGIVPVDITEEDEPEDNTETPVGQNPANGGCASCATTKGHPSDLCLAVSLGLFLWRRRR